MPISPGLPRALYGADYNPEQWPKEAWEDARLMREAGVNRLRGPRYTAAHTEDERTLVQRGHPA